MKITTLAVSILAGLGAGCATEIPLRPPALALTELPDCFSANYDPLLDLFTIRNAGPLPVNQQCLLSVGPGTGGSASRLKAGRYTIHVSDGGGGGAGGTWQLGIGKSNGGAGGGGAGAREILNTVDLTEGAYKLTIGGGGPGGNACVFAPFYIPGGPGWLGSPSNMVRMDSNQVVAGVIGADVYVRPTRAQNERLAGKMDGHGGSGPGQTRGGHGGRADIATGDKVVAEPGQARRISGPVLALGGTPGGNEVPFAAGGGGGATTLARGGAGGGERPGVPNRLPQRGALGSGGGGGEGSALECDAGAPGGHGFIAVRPN